jgi:hypothetical protein
VAGSASGSRAANKSQQSVVGFEPPDSAGRAVCELARPAGGLQIVACAAIAIQRELIET